TPTSGTNSAHFIRGTATGIDGIYTPFLPDRVGGLHLSGDTDNGIAFGFINTDTDINAHATGLYFAGLLSGADVGAPLNSQPAPIDASKSTAALWTGRIAGFIAGQNMGDRKDGVVLNLRVSFTGNGGTVRNWNADADDSRTVAGIGVGEGGNIRFLSLTGDFTAGGLLTGTVKTGTNTIVTEGVQSGTLNGIIGQEGAMAVFKSDDANDVHFAGGFAVVPTGATAPIAFTRDVTDPGNGGGGGGGGEVTGTTAYQAWATSLGNDLRASGYAAPEGASVDFIRLDANNNIVVKGIDFTDTNNTATGLLRLNLAATSTDAGYNSGVAYGHAFVGNDSQLYAGLLPSTDVGAGTDLGAPIAQNMATALWSGSLAGLDISGNDIAQFNTKFYLNVAFTGGSG
ncbi:MAG: hypothetical protein K8953_02660, partial [Proteobacteria bacterium]|nr:hypothetical protein [Pseudomonadota bacterium]